MTQAERVLAALRKSRRGITQVDFLTPTCDGGAPITRVGARVLELKQDGHHIITDGRRDSCVIYKLAFDAETPVSEPEPVPAGLFASSPRLAIFDDDMEAA